MRRKSLLLTFGLLLLFLGAVFLTFYVLYKHHPSFYRAATIVEGPDRTAQSGEFMSRSTNLMNSIGNFYPDWWEVFTTEQINAFLQEDFVRSWGGDEFLPEGFHDLRVKIDDGRVRIGCRYGEGFWSTILSIEVRMWLVANEINLIGVEVLDLQAGALPISRQMILDYISDTARRKNIEVKWFHRDGNPVAILKLQADQMRPTIQLQRFELQTGKIIIVGRSIDSQFTAQPSKPLKN